MIGEIRVANVSTNTTGGLYFKYNGEYVTVGTRQQIGNYTILTGDWELWLLSSGTLEILKCNNKVDIFLAGGGGNGGKARVYTFSGDNYVGGGGGGGGYTINSINHDKFLPNTTYSIQIGGSNGNTTAFSLVAEHGFPGSDGITSGTAHGGDGGSGGGGAVVDHKYGLGGNHGADGNPAKKADGSIVDGTHGGQGQLNKSGYLYSTHPFDDATHPKVMCSGGRGGTNSSATPGNVNSGKGGAGGNSSENYSAGGAGGSGIVGIRNHRRI